MDDIEFNRKLFNKKQTTLRKVITSSNIQDDAVDLLLDQHASLHSAKISKKSNWSFEDAILNDIDETTFRRIPRNREHSIVWCIWHLARIDTQSFGVSGTWLELRILP